ncbi:hypothetical protein FHW69_002325 [Luteibacter sp. Sphag1AF]|uniref:hypothetical protein n=1 Tax=Luteibacter sp. Sphag1AF TaxID=2587031 RepID=UPI001620B6FE|nr:hypothetical protein [Luteibacter sp. Sphag1AF]MBB3227702.1 hypothetical protein [Luteibacter sp. Sphag1AF]
MTWLLYGWIALTVGWSISVALFVKRTGAVLNDSGQRQGAGYHDGSYFMAFFFGLRPAASPELARFLTVLRWWYGLVFLFICAFVYQGFSNALAKTDCHGCLVLPANQPPDFIILYPAVMLLIVYGHLAYAFAEIMHYKYGGGADLTPRRSWSALYALRYVVGWHRLPKDAAGSIQKLLVGMRMACVLWVTEAISVATLALVPLA